MASSKNLNEWVAEKGVARVHKTASVARTWSEHGTDWTVYNAICGTRSVWVKDEEYAVVEDSKRFCPKCKKASR